MYNGAGDGQGHSGAFYYFHLLLLLAQTSRASAHTALLHVDIVYPISGKVCKLDAVSFISIVFFCARVYRCSHVSFSLSRALYHMPSL